MKHHPLHIPMLSALVLSFATLLLSPAAKAEQFVQLGDYVVHYNALPTTFLAPQVAQEYGIRRSKSRGMLNLSVQKKENGKTRSVTAEISATATNLSGQLKRILLHPVRESDAIYYIGTMPISPGEVLNFDITVHLPDTDEPLRINFQHRF